MSKFNEYSEKGMTLMQQALKKLADGEYDAFAHDRKEANRYFDLVEKELNSEAGKMTQLYGESRNFGIIYNVIEQNMHGNPKEDKKLRNLIKEMYNLIKGDKILNEQFKIYDFFEKTGNIEDAKAVVNESLSIIKPLNKKQVKESNEKLIKFIKKNKLDELVEIPEDLEKLYEAVEFVILNKRTLNNAVDFVKAQNVICEHIEKTQKDNVNEGKISNKELFNNFEEEIKTEQDKIEESINAEEKSLLEMFSKPKTDKRKIFNDCKTKTLAKINEAIVNSENEDKISWKEIYDSVSSKSYSEKLSENLINCAEMMEIYSTIDE